MKIAYVLSHNIDSNDGVVKKIIDQISVWEKQGHEVIVFSICKNGDKSLLKAKCYPFEGAIKSRIFVNSDLLNDITAFNPDILYFRYDFWNSTVFKLASKFKLIIESNTASIQEAWLQLKTDSSLKALLRYTSLLVFNKLFSKRIKGVVSVTNEIFRLEYNQSNAVPHITVTNSVNLDKYKPLKCSEQNAKTSLCFLGSPNQDWHGTDIIEEIAKRLPMYDFHIIGPSGENRSNLTYHGFLTSSDYGKILSQCHVAIGTLALHRKGLSEACPLKVREYLLAGFPIVLGYEDIVDKNKPSWCFKLDDLSDKSVAELQQFIERNQYFTVPKSELSAIDASLNEIMRLNFFNEIRQTHE
ncbi:hypothetical protein [Pseudoalteromonas xiamenensis]|uniref:Glycosyltransferase n=1 Tax=Pseudoalteromonas xiamenensis TaxID=882626 RepID=A0A975DIU3_9GAMM|nr:hypothetical protein [Pseudoalteromonas xiamenensis]QTH72573.1 hypothetical protein J5O05_07175 [Pseudoalteromonas xiamenensis]